LEVLKQSEKGRVKVSGESKVFSPSSLLLFKECQKKYEYKYVYGMPEEKAVNWEALLLGKFIHLILEDGVKKGFKKVKDFIDLAKELGSLKDWEGVELGEVEGMIKVFFERNKEKFNKNSKTEQKLDSVFSGIKFTGFVDRIDFREEGIEIIDYKTGKWAIGPRHRNWQLGYYALSARNLGKVKKITLEMLRQDRPLEFELDNKGNAKAVHSSRMKGFNIYDIEEELIKTARDVIKCYSDGFKACGVEEGCKFCGEYVYGN
jgi:hypothetical protein